MQKIIFSLYFLVQVSFGIFFASIAQAVTLNDLNVATVQVANDSASARMKAMPIAVGQVLIKMSGNPGVMTLPVIQNAASDVNGWIRSYSYFTQVGANGKTQQMLRVTFDKAALVKILEKSGQSIWSADRPLTLVWVNIQDGSQNNILSNTSATPILQALRTNAKLRGLPILLPAMDLQDQSFINDNEAQDFDVKKLKAAAKRYGASAILAGNISGTADDRWRANWMLLANGAPYRWQNTAVDLNAVIAGAVGDMANLMVNQLAVVNDKDLRTDVMMTVKGVGDLGDYAKVLKVLRHLAPVAKVTVKDMHGSDLLLQVKTLGGEQALTRAMAAKRLFTVLPHQSDEQGNDQIALSYRWLGDLPPNLQSHDTPVDQVLAPSRSTTESSTS